MGQENAKYIEEIQNNTPEKVKRINSRMRQRKYFNKNRDKLNERFYCSCGGKYLFRNRTTHFNSVKHTRVRV